MNNGKSMFNSPERRRVDFPAGADGVRKSIEPALAVRPNDFVRVDVVLPGTARHEMSRFNKLGETSEEHVRITDEGRANIEVTVECASGR